MSISILLIEDNPATRKMVNLALSVEGYHVLEAPDGKTALEIMVKEKPALVFLDLILPDMDGIELLKRLRVLPGGAEIPIIALSGFVSRMNEVRNIEAGFTAFLIKPVEPARLIETIQIYLPVSITNPVASEDIYSILAIDSDPIRRKRTTQAMTQNGFEAGEVSTEKEMIHYLERHPKTQAVVIDTLLTDMGAFELCYRLRTNSRTCEIPIILKSSYPPAPLDQELALKAGANVYFSWNGDAAELGLVVISNIKRGAVAPPSTHERLATEGFYQRVIQYLDRQVAANAGLVQRYSQLAAEISLVGKSADSLSKNSDLSSTLRDLLAGCLDTAGISRGALYLIDMEGRLRLNHFIGYNDSDRPLLEGFFWQPALFEESLSKDMIIAIPSSFVSSDAALGVMTKAEVTTALIVPLTASDRRLGALFFGSLSINLTEPEFISFAKAVSAQIRQSILLANTSIQLRHAQKMEAIGRLAGGIAHDFNNILAVIHNCTEFLLDDLTQEGTSRKDVIQIQEASNRAAMLVRQLLAFGRNQSTDKELVDVNHLIQSFLGLFSRTIPSHIQFEFRPSSSPLFVLGDPTQLEQVVMNLVLNARDAMPGGGKLVISAQPQRIESFVLGQHELKPGNYAIITVSDTGSGMTQEVQDRAFEPFFTTKTQGRGTGLGLSTVYSIVKQCGGWIKIDSKVGTGTTFMLTFPLCGERDQEPSPERANVPRAGNETVLLVEDEKAVREIALRILTSGGYNVIQAGSGKEALEVLSQHLDPIHMLITDMMMPGMSGQELASRLKEVNASIRVLFMSGYTEQTPHSPNEFLQKPFSKATLLSKVRDILDRSI